MCSHNWAPLMAQKGNKAVPISVLRVCVKCGELKVGVHTIRISKDRIDMDSKEIRAVGKLKLNASGRLKIPVGTDLYE